ncbi:Dabb family protein [Nocardiopsis alkaliphila]|uniref:Dabb family protein n=1 Tax=Nocardiopsis alkaliphila TaxID=225762 RepID=UPI0003461CDC|nr:Dabb family protein [Nocardiopsis alkaliphila]
MIYHCIRFSIKPGIPQEEIAAALQKMGEQGGVIPGVKSSIFGADFGGDYDFGAVSVFEDLESYEAMMNHPSHTEMDRIGLPMIEKFVSFDITDDPDPEVGAKITAIHQRRFDKMPDIAELVSDLDEYSGSAAPGKHGK